MIRRFALRAALLVLPLPALAQLPPSQWRQGYIPTEQDMRNLMAVSTGPGTAQFNAAAPSASIPGYAGIGAGPEMQVMHDLGVETPRGSPIAGANHYGISRHFIMDQPGVQDFANRVECDSMTTSSGLGGNVCSYGYAEAHAGSGQLWGLNWVVALDIGFTGAAFGAEFDLNNATGMDLGEFGSINRVGMLFNGLGNMNTAAISLQTGNAAGGQHNAAGGTPIWYMGLTCQPGAVQQACLDDASGARDGIRLRGKNVIGLDAANDNTSGLAIALGNGGPSQGIGSRVVVNGIETYFAMLYSNASGDPVLTGHDGNAYANANLQPTADNTFALGGPGARYANAYLVAVNGVPAPATAGAQPTGACAPTQQAVDATHLYVCLTDNKWHLMATAQN